MRCTHAAATAVERTRCRCGYHQNLHCSSESKSKRSSDRQLGSIQTCNPTRTQCTRFTWAIRAVRGRYLCPSRTFNSPSEYLLVVVSSFYFHHGRAGRWDYNWLLKQHSSKNQKHNKKQKRRTRSRRMWASNRTTQHNDRNRPKRTAIECKHPTYSRSLRHSTLLLSRYRLYRR